MATRLQLRNDLYSSGHKDITDAQLRKAITTLNLPAEDGYNYSEAQVTQIKSALLTPTTAQSTKPSAPKDSSDASSETLKRVVKNSSNFITDVFNADVAVLNAELVELAEKDKSYVVAAAGAIKQLHSTRRARIYSTAAKLIQESLQQDAQQQGDEEAEQTLSGMFTPVGLNVTVEVEEPNFLPLSPSRGQLTGKSR